MQEGPLPDSLLALTTDVYISRGHKCEAVEGVGEDLTKMKFNFKSQSDGEQTIGEGTDLNGSGTECGFLHL